MKKKSIIIDTDPGIDDAVAIAIALFSESLDVKLITTVAGNVGIDSVTYNAMRLLKYFNKQHIPVAKGASQPLLRCQIDASSVHGKTGMEGFHFEAPDMSLLLKQNAVEAMRTVLLESDEKIEILAIGPLTNLALLISLYPEVKEKIERVVLMGGSLTRGNSGVMSEFNFHADPEAAKMIFKSGLMTVMTPLDVGLKALVFPKDSEQLKSLNKTGEMFYSLFKKYRGGSFTTGLKMYDSCAIAYVLKPELFECVDVFVDVETQGELTAGCSVVDLKGYLKQEPNCTVCVDIDADAFKSWFMESVKECI